MPHIRLTLPVSVLVLLVVTALSAGTLDAPAGPTAPGSAMFTLNDLWNRLVNGTVGSKRPGGFTEPGSGPSSGQMHTLDEIMNQAPAACGNGAVSTDVASGKSFWGLTAGAWGPATGAGDPNLAPGNIRAGVTIHGVVGDSNVVNTTSGDAEAAAIQLGKKAWVKGAEVTGSFTPSSELTIIPGAASQSVPPGWYLNENVVGGDPDLTTGNIRAGVDVFGVIGSATVVDTSPGNATEGSVLYGFTAFASGTQITGMRAGGVLLKAGGTLRGGRWYDQTDGTIVDLTTGLVWLKDVAAVNADSLPGCTPGTGLRPFLATSPAYIDAHRLTSGLKSGTTVGLGLAAGVLNDGSQFGDWRIPTRSEMRSLITGTGALSPATVNAMGFSNNRMNLPVQADEYYWTSTAFEDFPESLITVMRPSDGSELGAMKTLPLQFHRIWPVRSH